MRSSEEMLQNKTNQPFTWNQQPQKTLKINLGWKKFFKNIQHNKSIVRREFSSWLVGKYTGKMFLESNFTAYARSLQNVPPFKPMIH